MNNSNNRMPTKQDCEITNAIRMLYQFYGRPDEGRIKAYVSQLEKVDPRALKLACSHAINEIKMFPSLSELKNLISAYSIKKKNDEEQNLLKWQTEQKRYLKIKNQFDEKLGLQHLGKYVKTWFIGVWGRDAYDKIKQSEFNFSLWEKPALFDLSDAQLNSQRAIEIGKRKIGIN